METISDKPKAAQPRDDAADIIRAVLTLIRLWGRITNRNPEAEGIAIAVLNGMQKD